MAATTLSIQQFHENVEAAEAASKDGPVFITEDGRPRRVLIDIAEYQKLAPSNWPAHVNSYEPGRSMVELLTASDEDYFDWDPPRLNWTFTPVEFD